MNVRPATTQDAATISAIALATWVDTYAPNGMNPIYSEYILGRFTPAKVAELIERSDVIVAETDFGLAGYALISASGDNSWEIETLYVLPKLQHRGTGGLLLDALLAHHRGSIWLKCADDNLHALAFYRKQGFIETGETWFALAGAKYRCLRFELRND